VTVVVPYYNGSGYVAEALASVRAQTRPPDEVLVVDDGSRPDEAAALDAAVAAAGMPCRVIHLPQNRGVSVARNVGVVRAQSTFIAFLDCDDLWLPDKLERQMRFFDENPDARAVHAGIKSVHADGREVVDEKRAVTFEDLVQFPCPILPSALVMQRDALVESGLFDPTLRVCQDVALCLRFAWLYPIGCISGVSVVRRVRAEGLSRNEAAFHHEADRVFGDFRKVFKNEAAAVETVVELHADFVLRALYQRDAKACWRVFRRATRHDVTAFRLFARVVRDVLRNRSARRA
jgi:glycosyltransferase involved in cell wall biosynthesis